MTDRKRMRFELFFERYFGNFHRIMLTNLLFAVPSAVVFTVFYFLNQVLFNGIQEAFSMLAIILLYPFYAGVVMVVRNIARGDENVKVVSTFLNGVKDNLPQFLLHGVLVCIAVMFSYYSITFYISLLSVSWIMYAILFFCIVIVLIVFFISFYIPLMTVTYDLKLRFVYKNSFLMSFGELKNNLFATLAIAVVVAICLTATAFSKSVTVLAIILIALWALIVPATFTFCYVFFVYDGMADMINSKNSSSSTDDKAALKEPKPADKPAPQEEDYSDIDVTTLKDTDDFIFHNGRMIKQSALLRMIREKEAAAKENKDE